MKKHYIAVLVPQSTGEWCAYLPDFPDCQGTGATPAEAVDKSRLSARQLIARYKRDELPHPRSLGAIQDDSAWASKRAIEWDHAVISLVGLD